MNRQLLILRHAKSDWNANFADFDRPIKKRGKQNAGQIGDWLQRQHIHPDCIISSPAKRAKQTIKEVLRKASIDPSHIQYNYKIYLAELNDLLATLAEVPDSCEQVLLVGHNPGMDELLGYLTETGNEWTAEGKLMTTAALAQLEMPDNWQKLAAKCARLITLVRASEL